MNARNTIRSFYFLIALTNFGVAFIIATYVMYLRSYHLSYLETNMVNFCFFATIFLFEIPTGAIADVFGRKISIIISYLLMGISMLLYALATTFPGFALAEMLGAIASTFNNGAFEAWMVDRLRQQKYPGKLPNILAGGERWRLISSVVGAVLGAKLSDLDMRIPWVVAGVIQLVAVVAGLILIKEQKTERKQLDLRNCFCRIRKTVTSSLSFARSSRNIRFLLLTGALFSFSVTAPNMQWQPFFSQFLKGSSSTPLGFISAAISLALIAGSFFTGRVIQTFRTKKSALAAIQIGTGLGVVLTASICSLPMALTVFLLHEVVRGLFGPIKQSLLHEEIPAEKNRATLVSCQSMGQQVGGMLGLLSSGLLVEKVSMSFAWAVSGIVPIIATLWLMRNGRTEK